MNPPLQSTDKNETIKPMMALSSQPYKGTRDYYPEQKRVQNYIFDTWKRVSQLYGYEEYGTPLLEPIEVYLAKSGEELATQQTYTFTDRGERTVAIRPEMTPSVSRLVAARRQELAYPARLFSIANFMRYERPQRGREREFWQLNADIFGAEGVQAEAEIIIMAAEYLKAFGADDTMFEIKINSRKVIDFTMKQYLQLDDATVQPMIKLLDRKDKIEPIDFLRQARDLFSPSNSEEGLRKLTTLLDATNLQDLPESIRESEELKEIMQLFDVIDASSVTNAIFDISLMRGLDYYTGIVFEVFDTDPENRRSAVGMAPGLTMTELFLQTHKLLPEFNSSTKAYIAVIGDSFLAASMLANKLRAENIAVELDVSGRKIDKQLKTADKKHVSTVIFVGESEKESGVYPIRSKSFDTDKKMSYQEIVVFLKS
jgi:histidyl-tRNA synthetase